MNDISRDDALLILDKWLTEETLVTALLAVTGTDTRARVTGSLTHTVLGDVIVESSGNIVMFQRKDIEICAYVESKDLAVPPEVSHKLAAEHGNALLWLGLAGKVEVSIFERSNRAPDA